jgi:hypothetical protein
MKSFAKRSSAATTPFAGTPRRAAPDDWSSYCSLTGEPEVDVQEAALESVPESEGWDPVPGSVGRHTPESFGEDEDGEGRSEGAQLVEEGVREAEHDQMLQAARVAQKGDQGEP